MIQMCQTNRIFKVVEEYSSIIGDAYEGKATINANHIEMCRFSSKDSSDYQIVSKIILRWVRAAEKGKPILQTRGEAVQIASQITNAISSIPTSDNTASAPVRDPLLMNNIGLT